MEKKSDKKTIIILLAVLALVAIGSGIWTYKTLKPLDFTEQNENFSDIQIEYVYKVKEDAINNVMDFLDVDFAPGTIWEEFYENEQFNRLQYTKVDIDTKNNIGNPAPFVVSTSTDDGQGETR